MTYTPEELEKILRAYERWLRSEEGGMRADLSNADLSWTDPSNVDLGRGDLQGSNLSNIVMMPEVPKEA